MKRRLTAGLVFGLLCSGQSLTIRLYDLANAPAPTVERASTVAGELLAGTGVTVIWEKGSPDFPEAQITDMSAGWSRTARDTREYLV
ncbi:MAG TPA: hypothetical protein VK641_17315, partial [Terriglobales bacterium]|nr:hypothetical protein [Terriglobales bacterium]